MDRTFNWGIIGPGRIAHRFAQGVAVIKEARVLAVASRDVQRAKSFAQQYDIAKSYGSYAELVADPQIDAVYIATPHRFHFEQSKLALEAGKPVLCEKPLTVNAAQAEQLFEMAEKKKLFIMEALWTRYLPIYGQVRQWLEASKIGKIDWLQSTFGFKFPRHTEGRVLNHHLAGGALLDIGIYPLAISQWVLNENPVSFKASGYIGPTRVDERIAANLEYNSGVLSQFTATLNSATANEFNIYGAGGNIRIHAPFWGATRATLTVGESETTVEKPSRATGFEYETEEAMRCIREGCVESPYMRHKDSLNLLHLMDAIRAKIGLHYDFE